MVKITIDKKFMAGAVLLVLIGGSLFNPFSSNQGGAVTSRTESNPEDLAIVYKSASCGCCNVYQNYLMNMGFKTRAQLVSDSSIKTKYNIPYSLQSCHTTLIGDYFIEGHVPVEVIEKLLAEKPDIAGIALPGMPSGSPGMPGTKTELWRIYSIGHDGTYGEFMVI
jgi:hypothetical protein